MTRPRSSSGTVIWTIVLQPFWKTICMRADEEQDDRRQREVPHERQAENAERHAHARDDHGGERRPPAAQHREG